MVPQQLAVASLALASVFPADAGLAGNAGGAGPLVLPVATSPTADDDTLRWVPVDPRLQGSIASPTLAAGIARSVGGVDAAAVGTFTEGIEPGSSLLVRLTETSTVGRTLNLEASLSQIPGPGAIGALVVAGVLGSRRRRP